MKNRFWQGVIVVVVVGVLWKSWGVFGRSHEEQVLDAQEVFLSAVERRDWEGVKSMMTDDYMDEFGHDREEAVEDARQALAPFFTIEIEREVTRYLAVRDVGEVNLNIQLKGTGAGYTQMVIGQVNQLAEPWIFHWHKKGRWPWDWKVVQIHNAQLMSMKLPHL